MQAFGERGKYIVLEAHGPNALDFHIAYYLGVLAAADATGIFHIISKYKGFDPLIQQLKGKGVSAARSVSIEAMPCFSQATASTIDVNGASDKGTPKSPAGRVSVVDMIKLAVDDLIKRKAARPRTPKTLRSTIHARCGKERPAADIDAVYDALVKRGYVKVDGAKVSYALPAAQKAV
jgi:PIN domain